MLMKKILLLGGTAGLLALCGCYTPTVNSVENTPTVGQRQFITDRRVVADADLAKSVALVKLNTATTPDDLLQVQVELHNGTWSLARFAYRFEWFDAQGMQVDNVLSATIASQIEGGEDKFISGIAPHPGCKDFRVKFIKTK